MIKASDWSWYRVARVIFIALLIVELMILIVTCVLTFKEIDSNLAAANISRRDADWRKFLTVLLVFTDFAVIFTGIVGTVLYNLLLIAIFTLISIGGDLVLVGLWLWSTVSELAGRTSSDEPTSSSDNHFVTLGDVAFSTIISVLAIYVLVKIRNDPKYRDEYDDEYDDEVHGSGGGGNGRAACDEVCSDGALDSLNEPSTEERKPAAQEETIVIDFFGGDKLSAVGRQTKAAVSGKNPSSVAAVVKKLNEPKSRPRLDLKSGKKLYDSVDI